MSASTSTSTSALPTLRQSLRQLPRAVGTAGPQLTAGFGLANSVPGVTEGNLRLQLAYGLLTPSLRRFPISDSDSVNFGLMFKQYREESSIRSGLLSLYAMA